MNSLFIVLLELSVVMGVTIEYAYYPKYVDSIQVDFEDCPATAAPLLVSYQDGVCNPTIPENSGAGSSTVSCLNGKMQYERYYDEACADNMGSSGLNDFTDGECRTIWNAGGYAMKMTGDCSGTGTGTGTGTGSGSKQINDAVAAAVGLGTGLLVAVIVAPIVGIILLIVCIVCCCKHCKGGKSQA